jgi:phosphoribosylaminoimidazole (AIR) synthetase
MDQVFNMGVGLVLVVAPSFAESIRRQLKRCKLPSWIIGQAHPGVQGVVWA